jgi:hypothetical protein
MRAAAALPLLLLCFSASAGSPAQAPTESPAVNTSQLKLDDPGTTIVGERDSDLGLYLTPWKEEHADNIDLPPSLLDEPAQPVDARGFSRQVREAGTIRAYRRELLQPNR